MQNREKQIEELTNELIFTNNYGTLGAVANHLYEKGYRKQSEECEKRIANQREEIRRLHTRINNLTQSRDVWKKQAERVGKQLHEVLSKQEWISVEERLPEPNEYILIYVFFHNQWQIVKGWFSYCDKEFHIANSDYPSLTDAPVTHWMPLPEAPKMKGGAE